MKTLLLLRHGKSSWDDSTIPDHDRPLKKRGIHAARQIGQLIDQRRLKPELILCSTATRARETLTLVSESAKLTTDVRLMESLYHCSSGQFAEELRQCGNSITNVMLVGHNPGLEEFLSSLIGKEQTMPTCALAEIELSIEKWEELTDSTQGRLVHLWRPRELKKE